MTNAERLIVIIFRDFRADSNTGLIRWFVGGFSHARTGGFFGTSPPWGTHTVHTGQRGGETAPSRRRIEIQWAAAGGGWGGWRQKAWKHCIRPNQAVKGLGLLLPRSTDLTPLISPWRCCRFRHNKSFVGVYNIQESSERQGFLRLLMHIVALLNFC